MLAHSLVKSPHALTCSCTPVATYAHTHTHARSIAPIGPFAWVHSFPLTVLLLRATYLVSAIVSRHALPRRSAREKWSMGPSTSNMSAKVGGLLLMCCYCSATLQTLRPLYKNVTDLGCCMPRPWPLECTLFFSNVACPKPNSFVSHVSSLGTEVQNDYSADMLNLLRHLAHVQTCHVEEPGFVHVRQDTCSTCFPELAKSNESSVRCAFDTRLNFKPTCCLRGCISRHVWSLFAVCHRRARLVPPMTNDFVQVATPSAQVLLHSCPPAAQAALSCT